MIKVTIITACFNSASTIEETIDSVLCQDYPNIEYIIVDGVSTDGTQKIVESFGDRIKFVSELDAGIYDAMNKGIRLATGDIIGIIGSDDYYPRKDIISKVAAVFAKEDVDSLYGDKQYVNNEKHVVRYWRAGEYKLSNFLRGWMPPHLAFYLKRDIYLKYGLYRPEFRISGDYELMLRMLYKNRISTQYLPEVLITMRTGGASTKNLRNRLIANGEDRKAWKVNGLSPSFLTIALKPLLKIPQFFKKHG